jgi:sulfur carrier protein ThiS
MIKATEEELFMAINNLKFNTDDIKCDTGFDLINLEEYTGKLISDVENIILTDEDQEDPNNNIFIVWDLSSNKVLCDNDKLYEKYYKQNFNPQKNIIHYFGNTVSKDKSFKIWNRYQKDFTNTDTYMNFPLWSGKYYRVNSLIETSYQYINIFFLVKQENKKWYSLKPGDMTSDEFHVYSLIPYYKPKYTENLLYKIPSKKSYAKKKLRNNIGDYISSTILNIPSMSDKLKDLFSNSIFKSLGSSAFFVNVHINWVFIKLFLNDNILSYNSLLMRLKFNNIISTILKTYAVYTNFEIRPLENKKRKSSDELEILNVITHFMKKLNNSVSTDKINLLDFCTYMNKRKWYFSDHQDTATKLFNLMFNKLTKKHLNQLGNTCDIYDMFTTETQITVHLYKKNQ